MSWRADKALGRARVDRFNVRLDAAPVLHGNGWVDFEGIATRAGLFEYGAFEVGYGSGTVRELRHPDDVFDPDSIESLVGVPFTVYRAPTGDYNHPPDALDARNTTEHLVGVVLAAWRVGDDLYVRIRVYDEAAIAEIRASGGMPLSCAYACKTEVGQWRFRGAVADARQTRIRYNHVAGVSNARAGETTRLPIDDGAQIQRTDSLARKRMFTEVTINGKTYRVDSSRADKLVDVSNKVDRRDQAGDLAKITIAGVEYEVPAVVAEMFAMMEDRLTELAAAAASVEAEPAPAPVADAAPASDATNEDAADAAPGAAPPAAPAAQDDERRDADASVLERLAALEAGRETEAQRVDSMVRDRAEVERKAARILDQNYAFRTRSDDEIRLDCIREVLPADEVRDAENAQSDEVHGGGYIRAAFDRAVSQHAARQDSTGGLAALVGNARGSGATSEVDDAQARYHARLDGKQAS